MEEFRSSQPAKVEQGGSSENQDSKEKKKRSRKEKAADFIRSLLRSGESSNDTPKKSEGFIESIKNMFRQERPTKKEESAKRTNPSLKEAEQTLTTSQHQNVVPGKEVKTTNLTDQEESSDRLGIPSESGASTDSLTTRMRHTARRTWHKIKESVKNMSSAKPETQTHANALDVPHQEQTTDNNEHEYTSEAASDPSYEHYTRGPSHAPQRVETQPRPNPEAQPKIESEPTVALASLSVYARLRSERKERKKLEKDIRDLSERVEEQERIIEAQRQQANYQNQHLPPVERPEVPAPNFREQSKQKTQQPKQQASEASHVQPEAAVGKTNEEFARSQLAPNSKLTQPKATLVSTNETKQGASTSTQQPLHTRHNREVNAAHSQKYEQTNGMHSENIDRNHRSLVNTYEQPAPSMKEVRPLEQTAETAPDRQVQFAESHEYATLTNSTPERRDTTQRKASSSGSNGAMGRARSAYEKLKKNPQSYMPQSREKLLSSNKPRVYADMSPFVIWVGIIGGWILFFLLLVWLLRSVFGIL